MEAPFVFNDEETEDEACYFQPEASDSEVDFTVETHMPGAVLGTFNGRELTSTLWST
jgi:hypothetical protein